MSDIDELKKMLEKHDKRISALEKIMKSASSRISLKGEKVILSLIDSNFFVKPKKFSDIIKKLKTQAKFDNKVSYLKILKTLTSEDKLERKMIGHQWMYVRHN